MKNFFSAFALLTLIAPLTSHALSFAPDTVFLTFTNQADCESQGGGYVEWYGEEYCTQLPTVSGFTDVSSSHSNATAIAYVKAEGIVGGYPDGTFGPDAVINRVELVKIMLESSGKTDLQCRTNIALTDVDSSAWYAGYVSSATCAKMVSGYPDGTFKPANSVTVAEAAKIISNGFGYDVSETNGAWYEGFINNLAAKRAIPTNISGVGAELTRGQMAEMIYRLKTGTTNLESHTLTTLSGSSASVSMEADVDAELDTLFEDIFDEDGLDLDSLLDF